MGSNKVEVVLDQKSSVVDVTKVQNRRCILPNPPLISSHKAGWENICLEYYQEPPFETPEHYNHNYSLVINLESQLQLNRKLNEYQKLEDLKPGDVAIIPPHAIHSVATTQKSEFIVLILDSDLVLDTSNTGFNQNIIEVVPHFSKPDPLIYQIALALKTSLVSDNTFSSVYAKSMATAISAHLLQYYSVIKDSRKKYYKGLSIAKLQKVREFILNHLAEDLLISAIANEIGMSKYHFARLFKQSTGISPYQYVIKCRIERAKILLSQEKLRISDVASIVGFSDQSQFTRHFKRLLGVTPQEILKH
jgi:AraC family transcriptional regulator